ncbi:hypothetical protein BC834DRAFT_874353 [Gloeopeniophorella convolvens]|nr:hypothetical protein BC834DRAFT_874353 [Gloeopeniophorella convolvens]
MNLSHHYCLHRQGKLRPGHPLGKNQIQGATPCLHLTTEPPVPGAHVLRSQNIGSTANRGGITDL